MTMRKRIECVSLRILRKKKKKASSRKLPSSLRAKFEDEIESPTYFIIHIIIIRNRTDRSRAIELKIGPDGGRRWRRKIVDLKK